MRIDLRFSVILIFVFGVSFWFRLKHLSFVEINSDALSSYLAALHFWRFGYSDPPNPESDHWMWISKVPWLWWASSLQELFQIRFFIAALIAPMGAWCAYENAICRPYSAALACGLLLAFDMGLIDTLISSFRGYMAPEWIALATVLFVLRKYHTCFVPFVGAMVIIASGHHPMSFGVLCGVLYLGFLYRFDVKVLLLGLLIFVITSGFRILSIYDIMQCDDGGWSCLSIIAQGSSEDIAIWDIFIRLIHDRFWIEMGFGSVFLLVGVILSPKKEFFYWTLYTTVGIVLLGFGIHTLRPYHLRIVALPMLVLGVLGWERYSDKVWIAWLIAMVFSSSPIIGREGQLRMHDEMAKKLYAISGDIWIESTVDSQIYSPGVGLAAVLSGISYERFAAEPPDEIILCLIDSQIKKWPQERLNKAGEIHWGGGFDWARTIHLPERVRNLQHD